MKRSFIMVAVVIFLMNTIGFAATTSTGSTTNVSVDANLNGYNCSADAWKKNNSYNHADLTNITGPNQALGTAFFIYTKQISGSNQTRTTTVANEYISKAIMYYDGLTTEQIADDLKGEKFELCAMLYGYPRVNHAIIKGYLVP